MSKVAWINSKGVIMTGERVGTWSWSEDGCNIINHGIRVVRDSDAVNVFLKHGDYIKCYDKEGEL